MVPYCINTIICSGLLFFLYKALLENEKMHVFKRFYLLFSIVVSLTTPLITISFYSEPDQQVALQYFSNEPVDFIMEQSPVHIEEQTNKIIVFVIIAYVSGLMIGLFRFVKKVSYFFKAHKEAEQILFNQAKLVLLQEEVVPHSFLNNIFLNKQEFKNRLIEDEILEHELAHVKQLHSLDVLFAQLVQCIFWFNPFFIFYKRAIQLNHEFLADEAAVRSSNNPLTYQQLLLNKASGGQQLSLASQFNYSIIKKRLVMITQQTSPRVSLFKKMAIIPLLAITVFLFAKKETIAQKTEPPKIRTEMPSTQEGVSQDLLKEYESIVNKHKRVTENGNPDYSPFSSEEEARLLNIYKQMSKEQQEKQQVRFMANSGGWFKPTGGPTNEQLKTWLDAKKYYVKIDGRKIKNEQLVNHKPEEFVQVWVYKPIKGSTDWGKYYAQINLMTKESYAKQVAWAKSKPYLLAIINPKSNFRFK
jgi:beta-lactamase regulating signal transducer with metallopeptidase domain